MNEIRSNDTAGARHPAATHEQMRYWLGELQALVDHMDARGWDDWARDHARSIIDFFSLAVRQHHVDVDRRIFDLLVAGRGDAGAATERMRQDRGWLEENWREVLAQLQPVAEGFGGYDVDLLRQASDVYARLLEEQLAEETPVRRSDAALSATA